MKSCLEDFLGKPVVIQLVEPIAAVHSVEEVVEEDGAESIVYGRAAMSIVKKAVMDPQTRQPVSQDSPILQQVIQGEIESVSDEGFIFVAVGGDGKTKVAIYSHFSNVRAVTFALEHIAAEPEAQPSLIIQN